MTPLLAVWAGIAIVVLILAGLRQYFDLHEDDTIHLHDNETGLVKEQAALAERVTTLTRWSRLMTVLAVVYGVGLGCYYLYMQWTESGKLPGS
jgi:hypothetical protein